MTMTQQRTRNLVGLGLGVSALLVTGVLIACGGDFKITSTNGGTVHSCTVTVQAGWPMNDGSVEVDKPAECPAKLPFAEDVDYAATGTFDNFSNVTPYQYQYSITNLHGVGSSMFANTSWNDPGNGWVVDVEGDYEAGSGGFDNDGNGFDNAHNQFLFNGSQWLDAIANLTYSYGAPGSYVSAPDSIGAGVQFSAHGGISDLHYVPPVTYQWTVDGSPVAGNTADMYFNGPNSGSMTIGVTTTDGNGVQYSGSHTVTTCSSNQIQC